MTNRYRARCEVCRGWVPRHGGTIVPHPGGGWEVRHLACSTGQPAVVTIEIGGVEYTRNVRGTCEDAPCCGCCTI